MKISTSEPGLICEYNRFSSLPVCLVWCGLTKNTTILKQFSAREIETSVSLKNFNHGLAFCNRLSNGWKHEGFWLEFYHKNESCFKSNVIHRISTLFPHCIWYFKPPIILSPQSDSFFYLSSPEFGNLLKYLVLAFIKDLNSIGLVCTCFPCHSLSLAERHLNGFG